MDTESLLDRWGREHFVKPCNDVTRRLPLSPLDCRLLSDVGLPIGPENALQFNLRFENVDVRHQPDNLRLLTETEFERTSHFPKTGYKEIDDQIDLRQFVVLGEVPNDFGDGCFFMNRFVCVAGEYRSVYWIYPTANDGLTEYCWLNSTLHAYLSSLLAYKDFRDERRALELQFQNNQIDADAYSVDANRIHGEFVGSLKKADPTAFEGGFWSEHASNEILLM